jgi:hypothetical protein
MPVGWELEKDAEPHVKPGGVQIKVKSF